MLGAVVKLPDCARCTLTRADMACYRPGGKGGPGCPTLSSKKLVEEVRALYAGETREFARQAAIQEAECYAGRDETPPRLVPTKPRIVETCEFAEKMGFKRIGLAFCIGFMKEAAVVADLLEARGFEVVSVMCKAGAVAKEEIGVKDGEKIRIGGFETMCNPILQAKVLDDAGVELNVVLGLCVGHDALFLKHSEAPCTVLAVKDRVTGHNPLAAIYTVDSYFSRIKKR